MPPDTTTPDTPSGPHTAPDSLGDDGRALWDELHARYTFETAEERLVVEACGVVDTLAALGEVVDIEGVVAEGSRGQRVVHPAVPEARAQRLALMRLLASLDLPEGGGVLAPMQVRGRKAARARWDADRAAKAARGGG